MIQEELQEVIEILKPLTEDLHSKQRKQLEEIVENLEKLTSSNIATEDILKIQDDLEQFSNSSSVDFYVRNEVLNVLSLIETLI